MGIGPLKLVGGMTDPYSQRAQKHQFDLSHLLWFTDLKKHKQYRTVVHISTVSENKTQRNKCMNLWFWYRPVARLIQIPVLKDDTKDTWRIPVIAHLLLKWGAAVEDSSCSQTFILKFCFFCILLILCYVCEHEQSSTSTSCSTSNVHTKHFTYTYYICSWQLKHDFLCYVIVMLDKSKILSDFTQRPLEIPKASCVKTGQFPFQVRVDFFNTSSALKWSKRPQSFPNLKCFSNLKLTACGTPDVNTCRQVRSTSNHPPRSPDSNYVSSMTYLVKIISIIQNKHPL